MNPSNALNQYAKTATHSGAAVANPHRLIQMLMEGALEKIAIAKGHMQRKEIADKGKNISWAISIVDGLRMSLDKDKGGDLAERLDALYDYMNRRLMEANLENNVNYLDEVSGLLKDIRSGWDQIPEQLRNG